MQRHGFDSEIVAADRNIKSVGLLSTGRKYTYMLCSEWKDDATATCSTHPASVSCHDKRVIYQVSMRDIYIYI